MGMNLFSQSALPSTDTWLERGKIEQRYKCLMQEGLEWSMYVSYVGNKDVPILRLYRFKEAFSLGLVQELLRRLKLTSSDVLLDPFCGIGTALLGAMLRGIPSVGVDRLPVAAFVAQTLPKFFMLPSGVLQESFEKLRRIVPRLNPASFAEDVPVMKIAFERETLLQILRWKTALSFLDPPVRECFQLLLMSILEPCSYMSNDGQFLRWKRQKQPISPEVALKQKVQDAERDIAMIRQLWDVPLPQFVPKIFLGDARHLSGILGDIKATSVITSPPYPNRYDYSRSYALELCVFFVKNFEELKAVRFSLLRSHIESKTTKEDKPPHPVVTEILHALQRKPLNNPRIPAMLLAYFVDMEQVIRELAQVLAPNSQVTIVVDNVRFEGELVPTDLIICDLAERHGFETERIIVARYKGNSSQQMGRYGRIPVRESVLFWRLRR